MRGHGRRQGGSRGRRHAGGWRSGSERALWRDVVPPGVKGLSYDRVPGCREFPPLGSAMPTQDVLLDAYSIEDPARTAREARQTIQQIAERVGSRHGRAGKRSRRWKRPARSRLNGAFVDRESWGLALSVLVEVNLGSTARRWLQRFEQREGSQGEPRTSRAACRRRGTGRLRLTVLVRLKHYEPAHDTIFKLRVRT